MPLIMSPSSIVLFRWMHERTCLSFRSIFVLPQDGGLALFRYYLLCKPEPFVDDVRKFQRVHSGVTRINHSHMSCCKDSQLPHRSFFDRSTRCARNRNRVLCGASHCHALLVSCYREADFTMENMRISYLKLTSPSPNRIASKSY